MRKILVLPFLVAVLLPVQNSRALQATNTSVSGRWIVTADFYGTPIILSLLELKQEDGKLSGNFEGDKLEGTITGDSLHFVVKGEQGTADWQATRGGAALSGSVVFTDPDDPAHPSAHRFTATLVPQRPAGPPQPHEFTPTVFYREFAATNKPVLTIAPGDSVHTTTVDAGGTDEKGVSRVLGGNPETGPFYIESAMPGDTLSVHITRLRLNRDWAESDDALVDRALDSDLAVKMKDNGKGVRWHLDFQRGLATPEKPAEHLARYTVPLKPMLGCVAVAPDSAAAAPGTGDSGGWGGNMDFNEIVQGATVYLPVRVPGALLYVGDGHALQGDGELNGNALETSMDVEFSVDVIPGRHIPGPRVESDARIMAMGLAGSLDDAFRDATANMAQWLTDQYHLTPSEVAQVLGTAAEYKVSEAADRNAGVVLKIDKERLRPLGPTTR
jgi:amidase